MTVKQPKLTTLISLLVHKSSSNGSIYKTGKTKKIYELFYEVVCPFIHITSLLGRFF